MALAALDITIVPTPSHLLDGHFPDGNDGTAGIPLLWSPIPDFNFTVGTPQTINLFSLYLTQPGDHSAIASLFSGSLGGGVTLDAASNLAYGGVGTGNGTIRVRATRFGATADSSPFSFTSAGALSPDNQAATIPTGLGSISHTVNSILVQCDAPMDAPTATITASGLKEIRFYKNGVFDGVTPITGGKSVLLSQADIGAGVTRRYRGGHYTALSRSQQVSAGGLPNPNTTSDAGPVTSDTQAVTLRYYWKEIETSQNVYNYTRLRKELQQCRVRNVFLFAMLETRTFATNSADADDPSPTYLNAYTDNFPSNGHNGKQMRRWDPFVLQRFQAMMNAIGAADAQDPAYPGYTFAQHPFFGGIATQETSTGSPDRAVTGYTPTGMANAIVSEAAYIAAAFSTARPMSFINFLSVNNSENTSSNPKLSNNDFGRQLLQGAAAQMQQYGTILAFPDLVPSGSITTRVYPIIHDYTFGTSTAGSNVMPGVGPTAASIQQSEWQANGNPAGQAHMTSLFNMATNTQTYNSTDAPEWPVAPSFTLNSPLSCPIIIWNWQTTPAGGNFNQQFNPDAVNIIHAHPSFGTTYTPPSSMVPGSLVQSGADYDVSGAGTGIGASSDQWSVGRAQANGDGVLIVELNGISGADTSGAIAGISIRETTDSASRAAHLVVTTSKIRSRYRGAPSAAMTNVVDVANQSWSSAKWLKIERASSLFSFYWSADGNQWNAIGSATIGMTSTVYVELFASSVTVATVVTAHFKQFNFQNLSKPQYNYTGLSPGTSYSLSARTRDQANNDSALSPAITVSTG